MPNYFTVGEIIWYLSPILNPLASSCEPGAQDFPSLTLTRTGLVRVHPTTQGFLGGCPEATRRPTGARAEGLSFFFDPDSDGASSGSTISSLKKQKTSAHTGTRFFVYGRNGGPDGSRTHDLFIANEALSQLSYWPTKATILTKEFQKNKPVLRVFSRRLYDACIFLIFPFSVSYATTS